MCVGKALTGGYLTLAATLCTAEVADGVSGGRVRRADARPDVHGQPAGLRGRAAPASTCWPTDDWRDRRRAHRAGLRAGLAPAARARRASPTCATLGAVGVVELDDPVDVPRRPRAALERGVWLRPFRDLVYTMPPYVTADDDLATDLRGASSAPWQVHG